MGDLVFPGGLRPDGLPAALSAPERLAAVTGCRRAFITLVDERRSFWKSCIGVDAPEVAARQNPVRESFCYFLVGLGGAPFAIEDAIADPRTASHPSVGPMKIGAWAGYPLLSTGGQVLGSMCVIDENPHPWEPAELVSAPCSARTPWPPPWPTVPGWTPPVSSPASAESSPTTAATGPATTPRCWPCASLPATRPERDNRRIPG
jgi:GAF domain